VGLTSAGVSTPGIATTLKVIGAPSGGLPVESCTITASATDKCASMVSVAVAPVTISIVGVNVGGGAVGSEQAA
jgi:hypothetical protein